MGTTGRWVTMGIPSDGSYGIPREILYGFPVTCSAGEYRIVSGRERMQRSLQELKEEAAAVVDLLRA